MVYSIAFNYIVYCFYLVVSDDELDQVTHRHILH